ncbi:hypothetical protein L1049_019853 [Liquidambar formosana]|uniref:Uncharacterized protein n=1 Tax=Liquidambar formosana TaxID=63359 RepID=A0AAP0SBY7_LIQFO
MTTMPLIAFQSQSQDHIWASHICIDDFCELYDGDHGEVEVTMHGKSNVKKFGIQLLYYDAERSTQSDCRQWIPCNSVSNQDAIVVGDDEDVFEDQSGSKGLKRGRDNDDADDDEAGLSHGWSDEDHHPKRLRYQVDSCDNTSSVNDP